MFFPRSNKDVLGFLRFLKAHWSPDHNIYRHSPTVFLDHLTCKKVKSNNMISRNREGTSAFNSFRRSKGSLTIEAALVLPIFLFSIISILSFSEILRLMIKTDNSISQCAKELAVYACVTSGDGASFGDSSAEVAGSFLSGLALSETYIRKRVSDDLTSEYMSDSPLNGNMYFLGTKLMEDEKIDICLTYDVMPYFALSPRSGFLTGSHAVARAFTGYDNDHPDLNETREEVVFITESGKAYHRDRGCPYLDLSIERVFKGELSGMRNSDGEIYHACPICGRTAGSDVVYITSYGNRYHSDLLCGGLKRTIEAVPISKVGGRHACPKCCN